MHAEVPENHLLELDIQTGDCSPKPESAVGHCATGAIDAQVRRSADGNVPATSMDERAAVPDDTPAEWQILESDLLAAYWGEGATGGPIWIDSICRGFLCAHGCTVAKIRR